MAARACLLFVLTLVLPAAGCVPHSLPLYAGTAKHVEVDGSLFLVRYTDQRAEATRMSPEHAPDRMVMLSRALRAMETASGCKVRPGTLWGDWSLAEAWLACPGPEPATLQPVRTHRPSVKRIGKPG